MQNISGNIANSQTIANTGVNTTFEDLIPGGGPRALEIKPSDADALYNQATVLRKLGHHAEALKFFDRLLAVKPHYAKAHNSRGASL